jgi:hypothetical protein
MDATGAVLSVSSIVVFCQVKAFTETNPSEAVIAQNYSK